MNPLFYFLLCLLAFAPCMAADALEADTPGIISAMKNTLEKNPRVLSEQDKISAALRDLKSEKFQRFPALSLTAETEGSRESQGLLRALQPLWVGGRIDNAISQSRVELELARTELLRIQRGLMEDTAVTYANLLGLEARIRAADKNIEEHQRLLDLIARRKKGSISSGADVQLARSRLSQAFLLKQDLTGQQRRGLTDLYALTLTQDQEPVPVPSSLTDLPDYATIESDAVGASPRLAQAALGIERAVIQRALNKSELMPRVYGRLDQELYDRGSASDQDLDTRLALVVEGSLEGAGFRLWEKVKAAEDRIRAAQMLSRSENNDVRRSIRSLLSDRDMLRELVELNRGLVASTGATLASYLRQYEAGRKSWLDLLNTQQEHARARLALEQVRSGFLQNGLRLAAQTGRLDEPLGVHP